MSPTTGLRIVRRGDELKKLRAAIAPTEHQSQSMLMQRAAHAVVRMPELCALFAIPNFAGHHGTKKARLASGARAKREGRKAGVPDLCLPVSRGPYHALYIEMKRKGESPKAVQNHWHTVLREYGNSVHVCFSDEEAWGVLMQYLALPVLYAKLG